MKRIAYVFIIVISFFLFMFKINAKTANVYVFYGKTCPHCHEAMEYLDSIKNKYDINIIKYEVWFNEDNNNLMKKVSSSLDVSVSGVPFVVIDDTPITGYISGNTDQSYIYHIKNANDEKFEDKTGQLIGVVKATKQKEIKDNNTSIFGKKINVKKTNKLLSAIMLGIKDGINLSLLWPILVITSILTNLRDKKKILMVGLISVFISVSAYLIYIISGTSFDNIISYVSKIRLVLSIMLMIIGIVGLVTVLKTIDKDKIEEFKQDNMKMLLSTSLSVLVMLSAVLFGLLNQGGTPTFLLVFSKTSVLMMIIYYLIILLINSLIFMVIYIIMDKLKLYNKYNKWSLLIASIIILLLAVILGTNPTYLVFNI